MIPSITLNALNSGLGHFGVALDGKYIRHIDTYGAIISESKTNIICFIRSSESEDVMNILEKSPRVSYYVGMVTHEAYNFKGDFQNSFSLDANFLKISENYRSSLIGVLSELGLDKEALEKKYNDAPDLGINFMVDKVFIQTPGPEAGKVIEG